jgi:DNA-binding protein HU-beta
MNKQQLVSAMSEKSQLSKKDAEAALNAFMATVQEALVAGDKVQLVGFGTFETRERAARTGRNPRNPEEVINIPASIAPSWKAGKQVKDAVNNK